MVCLCNSIYYSKTEYGEDHIKNSFLCCSNCQTIEFRGEDSWLNTLYIFALYKPSKPLKMKFVRILLIGLLAFVAIYLVLCFTGPKKFETSKSISINADAATVYSVVSDFNKWPQWSPWQKRDSLMKNTVTGAPSTVGHKMDWISESEGSGSLTIDEVLVNQKVTTSLKMVDWDAISHASFIIEPAGDSTRLTWTMDGGDIAFGFRGLMVLMSAVSSLEADYAVGLAGIKEVTESMPK